MTLNNKSVDSFADWKQKFGANFDTEEDVYRRGIFLKNLEDIEQHNGLLGTTYKKGVNQFTVLTQEEFIEKHLSSYPESSTVNIE